MSDNTSTPNRRRAGPGVTVKICGITNQTDALKAIDLGADALGFNLFTGSKRFIEFERNAEWIAPLRSSIATVAVLVNPTADEAIRVAQLGVFEWLQLHGNESPELCRSLVETKIPFIKAIPVTETTSAEE